jgi:hypothetical protein
VAAHGREGVSEGGDGPVTQSPDTSPEIEARMVALWRAMEPWQKFALVSSLQRMADGATIIGILDRHPHADEAELRLRLAALRYGAEFTREHLDWDPDVRGW